MEISELLIRILILLLPGILGTFIIESLVSKRKFNNRDYLVSVILISFSSYAGLFLFKNILNLLREGINHMNVEKVVFFQALVDSNTSINFYEVAETCFISIIISLLVTILINKGWYYGLFRKVNITRKTGNDPWNDLFENNTKGIKSYVYIVYPVEDRVYGGWVNAYSQDSENPELLLSNVIVTEHKDRGNVLYNMDKLYLKLGKDIIIEIVDKEESD